jgi:hypothetical protein
MGWAPDKARHRAYVAIADGKHSIAKPGETIALGGGATALVVSPESLFNAPVSGAGAPNPLCADATRMGPAQAEN